MLKFEEDFNQSANIKVIGIGGGGGNAVNRMVMSEIKGVEFISANTDAQALRNSLAGMRIQLGINLTKGLGVGGNSELGRRAIEESTDIIQEALMGADMVFITTGLGGGTGTGGAPIAAQISRELGALTVGVVTKPFMFEGKVRSQQAEEGLKKLADEVDTLIVIPNQRLFAIIDENTLSQDAYKIADDVLRQAVQSISEIITSHGMINVDFADVKTIMKEAGQALMGMGMAGGSERTVKAAHEAINCPLLEDVSISGAKGVLVNITGGRGLTMFEIKEAMDIIHEAVSPDANVFFGQAFSDDLEDEVRITVIATGFSSTKDNIKKILQQERVYRRKEWDYEDQGVGVNRGYVDNIRIPAFLRKKKKKV